MHVSLLTLVYYESSFCQQLLHSLFFCFWFYLKWISCTRVNLRRFDFREKLGSDHRHTIPGIVVCFWVIIWLFPNCLLIQKERGNEEGMKTRHKSAGGTFYVPRGNGYFNFHSASIPYCWLASKYNQTVKTWEQKATRELGNLTTLPHGRPAEPF